MDDGLGLRKATLVLDSISGVVFARIFSFSSCILRNNNEVSIVTCVAVLAVLFIMPLIQRKFPTSNLPAPVNDCAITGPPTSPSPLTGFSVSSLIGSGYGCIILQSVAN